jgi:1L-myo-inositol 1-phosphate cytidylyltransferase
MIQVSEAVILMAGSGSRLRTSGTKLPKPLISVLGRPLISYTFEALADAGITTAYAVVGFESEALIAQIQPSILRELNIRFIKNSEWQKQNGISVLAAANHVASSFLLTMSDHLFDDAVVDLLLRGAAFDQLNLAIDRKLDSIFDLGDAMKVQTRGDRIIAIGKELNQFDAIDTGLFVCDKQIFDYLERAKRGGDCSLADGVRLMAADGKVGAIDIGEAWWQDIDTPEMLAAAENYLRSRIRPHTTPLKTSPSTQAQSRGRNPEP